MSRTRIVKGKTTEIIGGDYSIYSLIKWRYSRKISKIDH